MPFEQKETPHAKLFGCFVSSMLCLFLINILKREIVKTFGAVCSIVKIIVRG